MCVLFFVCLFSILFIVCMLFLFILLFISISLQVYRPLPPAWNSIAPDKYHIVFNIFTSMIYHYVFSDKLSLTTSTHKRWLMSDILYYLSCVFLCMYVCVNVCVYIHIYLYVYIYKMSYEECARLRESVPYVKV